MTRTPEDPCAASAAPGVEGIRAPNAGAGSRVPIRLAAIRARQPATRNLIEAWLAEQSWEVADLDHLQRAPDVIIVEVSFPRIGSALELAALAEGHAGVPVVMVSPTIVAGTPSRGDVARHLGVAAVLGMPLSRAALLATIDDLTRRG